jgi:hypothetical protein
MSEQTQETPPRVVRDGYPAGVTCWVDAELPEPEAAAPFYSGLFGWELEDRMPADVPGNYLEATIDGLRVAALGSRPEGASGPPSWNTYVCSEDADATAAKVFEAGGAVLMEPFDVMEAGRMAVAADPQGAVFRIWQAGTHRGSQLVNEYGCWNFSGLTTTDTKDAARFYGQVFGWEAEEADDWTFFRVPGYGDHLAELIPGLREQMEAADAPPGFEDATAWVTSMEGQPEGTPPNWSVTFGVEDADTIAAKAKELGGTVLVEPFDAPPVRTAVIADPQGASFAVSRYYPPSE